MTGSDVYGSKSTTEHAAQEAPFNETHLTDRQKRLEDKRKMVAAINSGLLSVHDDDNAQRQPTEASAEESQQVDDKDFEPCIFFVYGTLMYPEVLMAVTMLDNLPQLRDAWIQGFEMKMWNGIYPVLIPNEGAAQGSRINGKAWRATNLAQCLRLQRYERSAYEAADCQIHLREGEEDKPVKGFVFQWAKDPKSAELVEGTFDLEHWQKTHKTPMF
ncbi:AIG2-like protein [Cladorrhinum sp. PSN259]|nr:AIG2-like protein [Cladorrhinum sp. PSN259]